jgi:3-deoxy-manno-octulosonate cytidylyltransferase (CMP-KDO synthetase)
MAEKICIVIPSRYDSKRFPGKPLKAIIAGVPLMERVWRIAQSVSGVEGVYIATDHPEIADAASMFGATVLMTPADLLTGTDRVHAALQQLPDDIDAVINLQGDAPLTPPWVVQALVDELARSTDEGVVTPAVELSATQLAALETSKTSSPTSGTTVTVSASGRALYFSKHIIPYRRNTTRARVYRHVGLYGYTRAILARLVALPPSMLEEAEGLEQLRALENDIPVRVVMVDYRGRTHHSIDHPDDIAIAEAIIREQGELETWR